MEMGACCFALGIWTWILDFGSSVSFAGGRAEEESGWRQCFAFLSDGGRSGPLLPDH